ncbi:MAG: non-homologous end-joining DNA ligase [Candidatus Obscuribacterales bacterium]|nr:non-homologous end-joining DNA ligase [Candidatus Obscuribacterales bacterium]
MLQEYKRKRDFKITPEPAGSEKSVTEDRKKKTHNALTFVIQKHAATRLHYDFRLEIDGVMVSWAVPKGPSTNTSDKRLAVMTEDHPMEYSSFEGIIPDKQYGAGEVIIWDQGTYSPDEGKIYSWDDKDVANKRMRDDVEKGKLSFYLKGEKLEGSWTLVRLHGKEKEWLLIKHHDEFENASRDVTTEDASVVSGLTLEDLQEGGAGRIWTRKGEQKADPKTNGKSTKRKVTAKASSKASPDAAVKEKSPSKKLADIKSQLATAKKASFPKDITPMLATLTDAPFTSKGWFFEPKLDGVRAIAYVRNGVCTLTSRNKNDLTQKYPAIAKAMSDYDDDYVFDGEVVALDEKGRPSFQHLQQSGVGLRAFAGRKTADSKAFLFYYVFDILYANGKDLTALTLVDRKKILSHVLQTNDTVRLVDSLGSDGMAAYQACIDNKLEGIVGKREDSTYEKGSRSKAWLKVKTNVSGEFLICGFTEGTGSRNHTFGSLLLGEYDNQGILQYVGGVGTGFDSKKLAALLKRMKPLETKVCPFKKKPPGKLNPTWLKPEIVVEIKYLERTQDNILRAPVYLHAREDIKPTNVKETPVVHIETKPKT